MSPFAWNRYGVCAHPITTIVRADGNHYAEIHVAERADGSWRSSWMYHLGEIGGGYLPSKGGKPYPDKRAAELGAYDSILDGLRRRLDVARMPARPTDLHRAQKLVELLEQRRFDVRNRQQDLFNAG